MRFGFAMMFWAMHVERNYNSENGVLHACDGRQVQLGSIRIVQILCRDNGTHGNACI